MKAKKNLRTIIRNANTMKKLLILVAIMAVSFWGQAQTWSLQQCIDTAQLYNKNLQIGRNNMAIGNQRKLEAKANLIPKVNIGGDYKYYFDLPYQLMPMTTFDPNAPEGEFKEIQFGVPHNVNANIQLAMPLYNPQVYGAIQTSKIASVLNELQYKKTEEQVIFDISNLYYNAQILKYQLTFIDTNLINTDKLLNNLKQLNEQQMIKKSDVTKVELQREQLSTQHDLAANSFIQIMNALKFSMGIPFTMDIDVESEIHYQSGQNYLNQQTIDLQLANAQNRLITRELKTLKNSRLPSANLLGNYSQVGFGYDKKPNEFLKFFPVSFVGVQLSYPLFNGTVTHRKINQKKIEIQNSELQISLLTEQNYMLIENAKNSRTVTQSTIANTLSQINLARTVYEQTLLQQKEGTANLTDVLLADNTLREAQQNYLSAIVEYLKADLELKKLTGNISSKN